MKIVVVTSCTKSKLDRPAPAEDLYVGQQHLRLMRGVRAAREQGVGVGVHVVSAKYGLVPGDRVIEPYEATFSGLGVDERRRRHDELQLDAALSDVLAEPNALAILCLGGSYWPCGFSPIEPYGIAERPAGHVVRFAARPREFHRGLRYVEIPAGMGLTPVFGCPASALKGELAGRLLERGLWRRPWDLLDPEMALSLLM